MKLTREQVQEKSQEKVKAIEKLCKQLEVVVTAEQMITQQGFIKHVVYYTDVEEYDMVEVKQPNKQQNEPLPNKEEDEVEPKEAKE